MNHHLAHAFSNGQKHIETDWNRFQSIDYAHFLADTCSKWSRSIAIETPKPKRRDHEIGCYCNVEDDAYLNSNKIHSLERKKRSKFDKF